MNSSYMGRLLIINLTGRTFETWQIPKWFKQNWTGGKGFGVKLLFDLLNPGAAPLSAENIIMFLTGPLTGTSAPSMRGCVVCKSPQTNGFLDSYFGGHLAPEIKYAGYDGILIHGRADSDTYIFVRNDGVEFKDARPIRGKDALSANAWIKQDINEPSAKIATIGPAGENGVAYSLISCEYNRQAGRGGAGAVMGSKNLKGLAVMGSRLVKLADSTQFQAAVANATAQISDSPECRALTESGTSYAVSWSSATGTLPVHNFKTQNDENADKLGDIGQQKHLFLGKSACFACPIRCSQMGAVRTGKYAGIITDTIEYESAAMLGSNLGIHDIRAVAYLAHLCDTLGVDSISMGNVIGFAFEAAQKGLIKNPEKISLEFGNIQAARYIIETVCYQRDDLGRLLGQGVRKASQSLDNKTKDFALHVRGLEIPGWAPRGTPGMGLAYMTADRGACHQRGFMINYETGGVLYKGKPVSPYGLGGKAEILKHEQDYLAGTDTLVKCDFAAFGVKPETFVQMLQSATGQTVSKDFLEQRGEQIWNLIRCFNLREGLSWKSERLPNRITHEKLKTGPHKDQRISPESVNRLREDYYSVRGWDKKGIPLKETLERLGLDDSSKRVSKEIL